LGEPQILQRHDMVAGLRLLAQRKGHLGIGKDLIVCHCDPVCAALTCQVAGKQSMKFKTLILPAINVLLWSLLAWEGFSGENPIDTHTGTTLDEVRFYLFQDHFYVVLPLIMLSVSVIPAAPLSQTRWSRFGNIWSVLTLLAVLPYLFFYGGGV